MGVNFVLSGTNNFFQTVGQPVMLSPDMNMNFKEYGAPGGKKETTNK